MGYSNSNEWGFKDWANMANTVQGAQQFVNTQQDRKLAEQDRAVAKGREQQYDTALGLKAQGVNEKPVGTSNAVWNQAGLDQNKVEDSNMRVRSTRSVLADKDAEKKAFTKYAQGYAKAGETGGAKGQLEFLKTIQPKDYSEDSAAASFHVSLKRNRGSATLLKQANTAQAQEMYTRITQGLGTAANEYARTGSEASALAIQQVVNQAPYPYDVKYDPQKKMFQKILTNEDGTTKAGGYIAVPELLTFAKTVSAKQFTDQYLQFASHASDQNAKAIINAQPWTNPDGETVYVAQQTNKNNMSQTSWNIYSKDGGKVSGGQAALEQLRRKGFTPGKGSVSAEKAPFGSSKEKEATELAQAQVFESMGITVQEKSSVDDMGNEVKTAVYVDAQGNPSSPADIKRAKNLASSAVGLFGQTISVNGKPFKVQTMRDAVIAAQNQQQQWADDAKRAAVAWGRAHNVDMSDPQNIEKFKQEYTQQALGKKSVTGTGSGTTQEAWSAVPKQQASGLNAIR